MISGALILLILLGYVVKGNGRDIQALLPAIDILYCIIHILLHYLFLSFLGT